MKLLPLLTLIPQLVPLAFLILASITAPTLPNIYLAKDSSDTAYGIFGYCSSDSSCTPASLHTDLSSVLDSNILSSSTINKLVPFLIIAPISAALTFISLFSQLLALILSKTSNFFKSTFYWLVTILISILAFLTSCFICIVTFLIFYPYVKWLAWCLIPTAVFNLSTVIDLFLSYNHLTSLHDDDDDNEFIDDNSTMNKNLNEKRFNLNDEITPPPHITTTTTNNNNTDRSYPQIDKPNNNFTFMSHSVNSSTSSSFFKDHDNNTAEKVYTQNSSANLRVPEITNPYLNDIDSSIHNNDIVAAATAATSTSSNNDDDDDYDDDNSTTTTTSHYASTQNEIGNRLDNENISANSSSSNFTSISQRPINPFYYAGASASIPSNNNFNRQPLNSSNLQPQSQYFNKQQQQQQFHQQRQMNQYQNQMSGMPQMQNSRYGNKPKPYMVMAQRQQQQQQFNRQPPYQNQFHQMNPYAPHSNNPQQQQRSNGFVPMKYRTHNNVSPAYSLGNDGPYSGFR